MVVNAQHIKQVSRRKKDVKDAEWIADLRKHGLLKSNFIPYREMKECTLWTQSLEWEYREHSKL